MQKSILITGCSSGIGLCAAQILHKKSYRVFATVRKQSDVEKLKAQGLESLVLDVDNSNSIRQALAEILKRTNGKLDALFNNAGFGLTGATEDLTRDMIRAQFETNVFGPMELTNLVIPIMRKQGHGRIIHNTSILGIVAMPFYGAYNASKFALEGFSNTLRQELHGTSIFVSIIAPGPIYSNFRESAFKAHQENLGQKESVHKDLYIKFENLLRKSANGGHPQFSQKPEAVVAKLLAALESSKPKAHYYVSFPAHLFALLRRLLPDSAMDWVMRKIARREGKA